MSLTLTRGSAAAADLEADLEGMDLEGMDLEADLDANDEDEANEEAALRALRSNSSRTEVGSWFKGRAHPSDKIEEGRPLKIWWSAIGAPLSTQPHPYS